MDNVPEFHVNEIFPERDGKSTPPQTRTMGVPGMIAFLSFMATICFCFWVAFN